jgi:hypothetical protein
VPVRKVTYFDPTIGVTKGLDDGNIEVLVTILNQVKALCPVNKQTFGGTLRNSYMIAYNADTGPVEAGFNDSGGGKSTKKIAIDSIKHFGAIGSNEDYAPYVEFGTRSHVISVKNAKVLSDGKNIFGKSVVHPGITPQPHLQPSVEIVLKGSGEKSALGIIKKYQKQNIERLKK